jgi:hypothetical protein
MPDFITGPIGKVLGGALLLLALYGGFRLWLHNHDASILLGYVLLSEKTTAEAKATEMERQRNEARQAINDYRKQLETAKAQDAKDDIETESRIRSYELLLSEKNRACAADQSDVDFILHKH